MSPPNSAESEASELLSAEMKGYEKKCTQANIK